MQGAGKRVISCLAAFICRYKASTVAGSSALSGGGASWREDLRQILLHAGSVQGMDGLTAGSSSSGDLYPGNGGGNSNNNIGNSMSGSGGKEQQQ